MDIDNLSQAIINTTVDLILITDSRGRFVEISPSCESMLGYIPSEMEGRLASDFIDQVDLDATRNAMRQARKGDIIRRFECHYIHKDGHPVLLLWTGMWIEAQHQYFFIGRLSEREVHRQLVTITGMLVDIEASLFRKQIINWSDAYLNDLTMVVCSLFAAGVLFFGAPIFVMAHGHIVWSWLVTQIRQEHIYWAIVAMLSAVLMLAYMLQEPLRLDADWAKYLRAIGYAVAGMFWALLGATAMLAHMLFGFVGIVLGLRSWWAVLRILIKEDGVGRTWLSTSTDRRNLGNGAQPR